MKGMRTKCLKRVPEALWSMLGAACIFACTEGFALVADAAPATLKSEDAAIYEQADESSNPVGNLVQGSSFEYLGDVTAEDGTVWHQVSTADGMSGYIKGDAEMEAGEEAPKRQEGQDVPGEDGGTVPETDETGEGNALNGENSDEAAGENDMPQAPEDPDENVSKPEDNAEEGMPSEPGNTYNMRNNRTKNYVLYGSGKIKEKENSEETDIITPNRPDKKPFAGMDMALFFCILVVFFCAGAIHVLLARMKLMKRQTETGGFLDEGAAWAANKKLDKKKRGPRRKNRGNRKQG